MKPYFHKYLLALAGLCCGIAPALSAPLVEYRYNPGTIYPVHTGIGIATQIVISHKEQVKDYGTGFSGAWELIRRDNVFYLKPRAANGDTNMYIRTDKRSYLFDLRVVLKQWKTLAQAKRAGVNFQVLFSYPPEPGGGAQHGPETDAADTEIRPAGPGRVHADYDYAVGKDSDWLIPKKAYDDGNFTFITLKASGMPGGGMPAVYGKKLEDGEEFLVNSRAQGNVITVFGRYNYLVLRHGDSVLGLRRNKS